MNGLLPEQWRSVKLVHCLHRRKVTVTPWSLEDETVGLVGLEDIQGGGLGGVTVHRTKPREIESLKTRFEAGDILYGKLRPYLNKVAIAPEAGLCSTEIWAFHTSSFVDPRYAAFFLASSPFVNRMASLAKGANLPRLDSRAFDSVEIPLPPLSEQQRIVDILQEAAAIRHLRTYAEVKTDELIPAMFFEHFVAARQNRFIPLHKFADVVSGVAIGRRTKGMTSDVSYMRVANVQAGYADLEEVKSTPATDEEILQFGLKAGDVLLTEGGDFDKLGRGCLWEGQVDPCIHQNHVFRVRPDASRLNSQFFAHYLQSARARSYFLRCAKKTTNLASINLSQLKRLPVPDVPLKDQLQFEAEIREAQSCSTASIGIMFQTLVDSLSAHAFSGQLTDEWRLRYRDHLVAEASERDETLRARGAFRRQFGLSTVQETADIFADRTDGIHAELNREQRVLYRQIKRMVGGVDYGRYFTAEQLADYVEGALHRNPQAIESHLLVFSVRGLVIPLSKRRPVSGEGSFASCYRLPLKRWNDEEGDAPGVDDDLRFELMDAQRRLATGNV